MGSPDVIGNRLFGAGSNREITVLPTTARAGGSAGAAGSGPARAAKIAASA